LRFFSPPEKPTLSGRFSISGSILSALALARTSLSRSGVESSASPRALRTAFTAARRKVMVATPGISIGYWKARNTPAAERSLGLMASRSCPFQVTEPAVTS
jgi:hypothetical protein